MKQLEEAALAGAVDADLEAAAAAPQGSADELIKRAGEALTLLEAQRKRAEVAEARATDKESKLEKREKQLDDERQRLEELEADLQPREEAVEKLERELVERREAILLREADADLGFARRNKEALEELEREVEELRGELSSRRKSLADERATFETDLKARLEAFEAELDEKSQQENEDLAKAREELEKEREQLAEREKKVRREEKNLKADQELLEEDQGLFDELVQRKAARELETKDGEISQLNERLEAARTERDRLAKQLAERQEADRRFGSDKPEDILHRLKALQDERDELKAELGARPSAEATQRLEELERMRQKWTAEREQLKWELAEIKEQASTRLIAVTELEALREEKRSLESANDLLREASSQLRLEVETLVKGAEGKSPFPECSKMDTDRGLQSSMNTRDETPDLAQLAHEVRHRMAFDPDTGKQLYYSESDVRSFMAGLAMSRLHLLQGISGTGKTSLPLAFARAIGAGSHVVPVQAGWRDKQDLLGHFNSFERTYYESEFLQALYRASCPRYKDTPFILVLDEMNLSHPEQYFADLLAALELDESRRLLDLMTKSVDPAPDLLVEGRKLPVPPNVWFVGTANHDETTKEFADKTFDRSYVLELPRRRKSFSPEKLQPTEPLSITALMEAFDKAANDHAKAAAAAHKYLVEWVADTLDKRFRVGLSNRLESQMERYVPVVIAAGGSVGEATDHILALRLIRKLRDRYDNRPEDIENLKSVITTSWETLDKKSKPVRSIEMLNAELRRLGHDVS